MECQLCLGWELMRKAIVTVILLAILYERRERCPCIKRPLHGTKDRAMLV